MNSRSPGRFGEEDDEWSLSAQKPCPVARMPEGKACLPAASENSSWDESLPTDTAGNVHDPDDDRKPPATRSFDIVGPRFVSGDDPSRESRNRTDNSRDDRKPSAVRSVESTGPRYVPDDAIAASPPNRHRKVLPDNSTFREKLAQARIVQEKQSSAQSRSTKEVLSYDDSMYHEKRVFAGTSSHMGSPDYSSKHAARRSRRASGFGPTPGARWMRGSSCALSDEDEQSSVVSLEHSTVNSLVCISACTNESDDSTFRVTETPHIVTATKVEEEPEVKDIEASIIVAVPEAHLRRKRNIIVAVFILSLIAIIGLAAGLGTRGDDTTTLILEPPTSPPTPPPIPTLEKLMQENVLRCGVSDRLGFSYVNETTGEREGFEVDLVSS